MACAKLLISPSELPHIFLLDLRRIFPISICKFSRLICLIKDQNNPLINKNFGNFVTFSLVMYRFCQEKVDVVHVHVLALLGQVLNITSRVT